MFCSKCGAKNDDNSKFCFQCGNRIEDAGIVSPQQPQVTSDDSTYNQPQGASYSQIQPQGPSYSQPQGPSYSQPQGPSYNQPQGQPYGQPGQGYYQPQTQAQGQSIKLPGKSKKPLFIGIIGAAAVLVIIIAIVMFSSKGGKIFDNILSAAKGTIESDSFDFSLELTQDYSGAYTQEVKGTMVLDFDKEEIGYDFNYGDGDRQVLYEGVMYDIEDDEVWYSDDISSELGDIFEYYDEYKGALKGLSDVDWEEAIDDAGLSRFVDTDKLAKCIKQFEENINSKKYWEEVCNKFSVKGSGGSKTYSFDVDVPKLLKSLLDTFKPAIDYNLSSVRSMISKEADIFDEFLVEITIKDNKLTALNVKVTYEGYGGDTSYEIKGKISNYGKAKLDIDEIEEVIQNQYRWN